MKKIIALVVGLLVGGSAFGADPAPEMIKLMTSDGQAVEIERAVAIQSETIKNLLDDLDEEELEDSMPLPSIDLATLEKLIPLMNKQRELKDIVAILEIEGETPETDSQLIASLTSFAQEQRLTLQDMPALARAANYLDLGPGLQALIKHYADLLYNLDNQQAIIEHFFKKSHTLSIDGQEREYPGLTAALNTHQYRNVIPAELLIEVIQAYYARYNKYLDFNQLQGENGNWPRPLRLSIRVLMDDTLQLNRYNFIATNAELKEPNLKERRETLQKRLAKMLVKFNTDHHTLDLRGLGIEDLDGLRYIPNINECSKLNLYGNKITTIDPGAFQGLNNLRWLHLRNNPIAQDDDAIARIQAELPDRARIITE